MRTNTIFLIALAAFAAFYGWRLFEARKRGGLLPGIVSTWAAAAIFLATSALLFVFFHAHA